MKWKTTNAVAVLRCFLKSPIRSARPSIIYCREKPPPLDFLQALQVDAERQVNRFVPHATAAFNFYLKRVQIENRVNRIERARLPGANFIKHGITLEINEGETSTP